MSKELIRLRNIRMAFDDEVVLNDLNLYINDKEFLTLLGPSGCGKTTTLRIIGGFTTPVSGDVLFDGVRINDVPPYRRQINTVFQKYALFPHMNVFENVAFGLRTRKMDKALIDQKVTDILEVCGLTEFVHGHQERAAAVVRGLLHGSKTGDSLNFLIQSFHTGGNAFISRSQFANQCGGFCSGSFRCSSTA
mgnify:CR=1 FL=1